MNNSQVRKLQRAKRQRRVRAKVAGTADKPRLSVFRSNKYLYAQLINDEKGVTLAASNSRDLKVKDNPAVAVGADLAKKAQSAGISDVVFDRSGYRYTGQIKQLADAAREAGLNF